MGRGVRRLALFARSVQLQCFQAIAVIFHSDNLELSEQFDATTGYEKSVSNLTWSYASFLSAVRARTAI